MSLSMEEMQDAGFGTSTDAEMRSLTLAELQRAGERMLAASTNIVVGSGEQQEANVPGIDNQRLRLYNLGLVALTIREEAVLRAHR